MGGGFTGIRVEKKLKDTRSLGSYIVAVVGERRGDY